MTTIADIQDFLDQFAPPALAEDWDNVGLLVGDPAWPVRRLMTCLTVTPASAAEAVAEEATLIVAHHPLPFRPLKRLTPEHTPGRLLLELIRSQVGIYSPHTAFDSARGGINQQLAEGLGLTGIRPLVPAALTVESDAGAEGGAPLGAGRYGELPAPWRLGDLAALLKGFLGVDGLHCVGAVDRSIRRVAVACGSAGEFLHPARAAECELLVTGETSFHTCLEAEASDVALLLPGHYASERFAVERLAEMIAERFPALDVWPSRREADPLAWL